MMIILKNFTAKGGVFRGRHVACIVVLMILLAGSVKILGFGSSTNSCWLGRTYNGCQRYPTHAPVIVHSSSTDTCEVPMSAQKPCFWKPITKGSRWQPRIHLEDLRLCQKLTGHVVQELLEGKTGPKMYFECGIGRTNSKGDWSIVTGMLRLDRGKASVVNKRAARLRKKTSVDLYVSRVQLGCGRLEVCEKPEDVQRYQRNKPVVPVSSLKEGQEVRGEVVKVMPYGVMVDVGANRMGLLHIQKVADLYGRYINKEKGLAEAGLERGARVRLAVDKNEKRRLFLDFTLDVRQTSPDKSDSSTKAIGTSKGNEAVETSKGLTMSQEELAEWAAYVSESVTSQSQKVVQNLEVEDFEEDDDFDKYDEERDIEDSLGLGYY